MAVCRVREGGLWGDREKVMVVVWKVRERGSRRNSGGGKLLCAGGGSCIY